MNALAKVLEADIRSLFGSVCQLRAVLDRHQLRTFLQNSRFRIVASADGDISTVYESGDRADFSRQTGNFDLHKDGLYYPIPPDFVLLYCIEPGRGDSPTVVVDTRPVVTQIENRREFEILKKAELVYRSKNGDEHSRGIIESHPQTGWPVLNIGARAYVRPGKSRSIGGEATLREVTMAMSEIFRLLDSAVVLRHFWKKDDLLLIDNHTFVHGRQAKSVDHKRKLYRVWLSVRGIKGSV